MLDRNEMQYVLLNPDMIEMKTVDVSGLDKLNENLTSLFQLETAPNEMVPKTYMRSANKLHWTPIMGLHQTDYEGQRHRKDTIH